ncbi:hypothetical protein J5N97_002097 [Dioscorea zingiberensis]|uniref:Uncharacterized protein n=1 Tax=Dioscorea zingiberensis TaxID=325984 RepID=A0A9D5D231_9LILI|nr:hypothetical protein J5N97_002097 [Dioscorea zingiberensis]
MANSFSDFTVATSWKEGAFLESCEHHDDDDNTCCDHSMDFHLQDLSLDFLPANLTSPSSYLSASPFLELETHPLPLDRDCLDVVLPHEHGTSTTHVNEFNLEFQGEISVNHDFNLQAAAMDINVDISLDDFHLEPAINDAVHRESDNMNHNIVVAIAGEPHQNVSLLDTQASSMGLQLGPSLDVQLQLSATEISNKTTRMRWTQELHDLFVQAVDDLGGPEKIPPRKALRELQIQTEENGRRLQEFIENQREAFMMVTKSISSSRVAGETPLVEKPSALVNLEHSTGSLDVIDVNSDTEEAFPSHKRARLDHPKTMKFRGKNCKVALNNSKV